MYRAKYSAGPGGPSKILSDRNLLRGTSVTARSSPSSSVGKALSRLVSRLNVSRKIQCWSWRAIKNPFRSEFAARHQRDSPILSFLFRRQSPFAPGQPVECIAQNTVLVLEGHQKSFPIGICCEAPA